MDEEAKNFYEELYKKTGINRNFIKERSTWCRACGIRTWTLGSIRCYRCNKPFDSFSFYIEGNKCFVAGHINITLESGKIHVEKDVCFSEELAFKKERRKNE